MLCYRMNKSSDSFMNHVKLYRVRTRKVLGRLTAMSEKRGACTWTLTRTNHRKQ